MRQRTEVPGVTLTSAISGIAQNPVGVYGNCTTSVPLKGCSSRERADTLSQQQRRIAGAPSDGEEVNICSRLKKGCS